MNLLRIFAVLVTSLLVTACQESNKVDKEPWIDKPITEWPNIVLRNRIELRDTTFDNFANAFLIEYNNDTLGITCKHVFLALRKHLTTDKVIMYPEIKKWELYSKKSSIPVELKPINKNETIGEFNTLKSRDWLILHPLEPFQNIHPLTIRNQPVNKGETVYAITRHSSQNINSKPELRSFTCYKNLGPYYYMQPTNQHNSPAGTSGSPVIDQNGQLIGLTSGQEGKLTVIASVKYLKSQLNQLFK